ncbi:MAG: TonB-dependent receptor [Paludibacteraceae bacterium]|nr:TonB-dependent receptor [Paludibacteraceae bacterium]
MKNLILTFSFLFACAMAWAHPPGQVCTGHHEHEVHSHEDHEEGGHFFPIGQQHVDQLGDRHNHDNHNHDGHNHSEELLQQYYDSIYQQMEGDLDEVSVTGRSTINSKLSAGRVSTIGTAELCRAACCNLSESFETNASVDVSYADAATGAKQIKLLGLSGIYVQMLTENMSNFGGLATLYGLGYVPGAWLSSVSISKGTSSVVNGAQGISGQINIEYKKPQTSAPFSINFMANSGARMELNADGAFQINDHLSTMVLGHVSNEQLVQEDGNGDGFLDMPLSQMYHLINRWNYAGHEYSAQWGINGLYEDKQSGQLLSIPNRYGIDMKTIRAEAFTKHAIELSHQYETSLAFVGQGVYHQFNSLYGNRLYNGTEGDLLFKALVQSNLSKCGMHSIKGGVSFSGNWLTEQVEVLPTLQTNNYVPGIFAEYTFNYHEKWVVLAGIRADYSNLYGFYVTPRLHLKYMPIEQLVIRASAGKGYRTPHVYAENSHYFASSRALEVAPNLRQEDAWNTGVSISGDIPLGSKTLSISADYYYTHFLNQVVVDVDTDAHKVLFYNSDGAAAYSHNVQVEATVEPVTGLSLTAAYKYSDARSVTGGELRQKALSSPHKGLVTVSYKTQKSGWQFDATWQINGGGRMPLADANHSLWEDTYKPYHQLMAQVTKNWDRWSLYVGAENMTNYRQPNPIIGAQDPWSSDFDATVIYGPLSGWKVYAGFRFELAKDK